MTLEVWRVDIVSTCSEMGKDDSIKSQTENYNFYVVKLASGSGLVTNIVFD